MVASDSNPPEARAERKVPIKFMIMTLVVAQPILVAASLFYTEVINKTEPVRCDPALVAALEAPVAVPQTSYYPAGSTAYKAYEEGYTGGYKKTLEAILAAGCGGKLAAGSETAAAAADAALSEEESARLNGSNDGALAAKQLPRECLNNCWQRAVRSGAHRQR